MKKATHNSATGERPYNIWAKLFSCVAKCQKRSIIEQFLNDTVLFDVRVRYDKYGSLRCCHGLAVYDITLGEICQQFKSDAHNMPTIMVTYEGDLPEEMNGKFASDVNQIVNFYHSVHLGYISVKKPTWHTIVPMPAQPTYICNYTKIVGWKVLLPFPRLWQWINRKDIQEMRDTHPDELLMEDFI